MILNGLFNPCLSAIFGFCWVVGRCLYGHGYAKNGPDGRKLGAIISNLAGLFPLYLMTLYRGMAIIHGW
jgi:hypothetical protein